MKTSSGLKKAILDFLEDDSASALQIVRGVCRSEDRVRRHLRLMKKEGILVSAQGYVTNPYAATELWRKK